MHTRTDGRRIVGLLMYLLLICVLAIVPAACSRPAESFTVGILNSPVGLKPCVEGFKAGMSELGYSEGRNIHYIYNGPVETTREAIDAEILRLLSLKIDLLFTTGNEVTLWAGKALSGSDIPVVFGACSMVVEHGIVEDFRQPGGKITGVEVINSISKTMEWMKIIIPEAEKVYLPFNPEDVISSLTLTQLSGKRTLGDIEFIMHEIRTVEEAVAAIETLPGDIDAVLRIPSSTLDPGNYELSRSAMARGLPLVSVLPLDGEVLVTFNSRLFNMGKQSARLAHQIHLGIKPEDLPIERAEPNLIINLQAAHKLGLHVPDEVLLQANRIIR